MNFRTELILNANELPSKWNSIVAKNSILLSTKFLKALQESQPKNMQNYFAAFYKDEILIGGALLQYLDFKKHEIFRKSSFLNLNNLTVKFFANSVLIVGNNLVTGQNGFYFDLNLISKIEAIKLLEESTNLIQQKIKKSSLILLKDYEKELSETIKSNLMKDFNSFSVQPNMILELKQNWKTFDDYLENFTTKYRTRAKSAIKKLGKIEKKELTLAEIKENQKILYLLYLNVANDADFNTFIIPENHFFTVKKHLKDNFKVFAYFENGEILSFYTLFINHEDVDTYFLGYDKIYQKSKQLYLNMLLDMVNFGILNQKKNIIFGRTALEIKSTIGAKPQQIFGIVKHQNSFLNLILAKSISNLNPSKPWIARQPFK
ncbi:hypothetical protein [Halpernia frigidisoli]|uniref:8-amino-7-oxononanoate synthase n=1 Tax=Halpernia frigidisoli TaxID=1125876 RepID=A0A1I3FQP6_9FLAO|nr:hypothetical protein [Halpernia frigidisoli]SFI13530.1 hypothetical protein SAMN05443292_1554 [Halpernia frigidisoli]